MDETFVVGVTFKFRDGCGDDIKVILASFEVGGTLRLFRNSKYNDVEPSVYWSMGCRRMRLLR